MKPATGYLPYVTLILPGIMLIHHLRRTRPRQHKINCADTVRLGDSYGGWVICAPTGRLSGNVVYSIGVGRNIEWDKAMMRRYGTRHHGWDPTPTAESFFAKKPPPRGFSFHRVGLAASDGNVSLKLPEGNTDSYTVLQYHRHAKAGTVVTLPMLSIQSMLKKMRHTELAILKMDIEGAEFDVIAKWSAQAYPVPADQVLVEFHERYFRGRTDLVPVAVAQMKALGFDMVHRTKLEYTFAKRSAMQV